MIQRIQSLWFLVAAIVMAGVFYFPIYKFPEGNNLMVGSDYLAAALSGLSILLSLVAIFSFKKRKNQHKLCWFNILCCIILLAWFFYLISFKNPQSAVVAAGGYYWIGAFLPLLCIFFLFLARSGLRKDERLIKSMDRLR